MPRPVPGLILRSLAVATLAVLSACADTPNTSAPGQRPGATRHPSLPVQPPVAPEVLPDETFEQWRARFRQKPPPASAPPFSTRPSRASNRTPPWSPPTRASPSSPGRSGNTSKAVSPYRVRKGQALLAEHARILDAIEQRYAVDRQTLVAVWGMESSFGQFMGDKSVIRSPPPWPTKVAARPSLTPS